MRFDAWMLVAFFSVATVNSARAQSITAQLSGTIYDQHRAVVPDAAVMVVSVQTGQKWSTASGRTGRFTVIGLVPGLYEVQVNRNGFELLRRTLTVAVGDDVDIEFALGLERVSQDVEVTVPSRAQATAPRRVFTTADIDNLPVMDRDFTNLALLTPGILQNQVGTGSSTGITAVGQTGRNNGYFIDGMTLDDSQLGNARGGLSLDTVRQFVVLSNGFTAEYGQASGAVISVVTRSGTNNPFGRAFYYHRDDAWDATPHEAFLPTPPLQHAPYEEKIGGGFVGGPFVRDRAFYFGSIEQTMVDTEAIITSPFLHTFDPDAKVDLPSRNRITQAFGRGDMVLGSSGSLSPRIRLQRTSTDNLFVPADVGNAAPERANDFASVNSDVGLVHARTWGSTRMNEVRGQFARRNLDRVSNCPGCPSEEHRDFKLGKVPSVPNGATEKRWQFADTLSANLSNGPGEHTLKAGVDVSLISVNARGLQDQDGTFTFNNNLKFDPADRDTFPIRYTQTVGNSELDIDHRLYAAFVQDRWTAGLATLDAGVRWDYDNAPGVSRDTGDVAPRLAVALDPMRTGRTIFRGGYGRYYDQVPLSIAIAALQAQSSTQIFVRNPDYHSYANSTGPIELPPNTSRLLDLNVPRTDQFTIGVTRVWSPAVIVAVDVVEARGQHLLMTRDLNYPLRFDLPSPPRPNGEYQRVAAVDSIGHSWYRALQVGAESRARMLSWSAAYTWSLSERDTEDFNFSPQDQTNPQAERGPAANDVRHRLVVAAQSQLRWGLQFSPIMTLQSGLPYTITRGIDWNHDLVTNDRPDGVARNSARGGGLIQIDARVAKLFRLSHHTVQGSLEAFNVTNRANWTGNDGKQTSLKFGGPTSAAPSRQIQIGARFDF